MVNRIRFTGLNDGIEQAEGDDWCTHALPDFERNYAYFPGNTSFRVLQSQMPHGGYSVTIHRICGGIERDINNLVW